MLEIYLMMTFLEILLIHQKKALNSIKKQECLKGAIEKGKGHLLGSKWTHEKVNKASDETIHKKGEKTGFVR